MEVHGMDYLVYQLGAAGWMKSCSFLFLHHLYVLLIRLSRLFAYSSYVAVMELGELTKPVEDVNTCSSCSFRLFSRPNKFSHINWRFNESQNWSVEAKKERSTRGVGVTSCISRVQSDWLTCTSSTLKVFRHLAPLEINPQPRVIIVLP